MRNCFNKTISVDLPALSREQLLAALSARHDVKGQADVLFIHTLIFGKEHSFAAARYVCRSGAMYPCSFSVLRFLSHKSAAVLQSVHGISSLKALTPEVLFSYVQEQGSDTDRLFFLTLLSLSGFLSYTGYKAFIDHPAFAFENCPAADIVHFGGGPAHLVISSKYFTEMINAYSYDDYSDIPDLIPLHNYGLKVDGEKWQRQNKGK